MNRSPEQKAYGAEIKLLSDDELFVKLRSTTEQLRSGGRFSDVSGKLMWQSMALEAEVIDRFPEERLQRSRRGLLRMSHRSFQGAKSDLAGQKSGEVRI